MEFYKLQLERTPEVNKPQKDDLEKEIQKKSFSRTKLY